MQGERRTVQIALVANAVIAIAKVLVAARVDLVDGVDGDRIEQMAEEVDAELRRAVPDVSDVYLDPTSRSE